MNQAVGSTRIEVAANQRFGKLGVEVRLGHNAEQIDRDGIMVAASCRIKGDE